MNFMRILIEIRGLIHPRRIARRSCVIGLVFTASLQLAGGTFAALITLQEGLNGYTHQDATVRRDGSNANMSNNTSRTLAGSVGSPTNPTGPLRAIFSFPLTGIPSGAVVNSVLFRIGREADNAATPSVNADFTVELRSISTTFNEGAATWNSTFAGGMTLGTDVLSSTTMNPEGALATHTFSSTPNLVAAVQAALDASLPFNFSVLAQPAVETGASRVIFRMGSAESNQNQADPSRPTLEIDYSTVPEPGSTVLVFMAACWICMGARALRRS